MKNTDNLSIFQKAVVGAQFLFVAFDATVLVPLPAGLAAVENVILDFKSKE